MAIEPLGSVEASAEYSPLTLVMRYLNSKGITPNAATIREALTQNARNPGLIEGLRNPEVEDSSPRQPSTRVAAKDTPRGQYASSSPERPSGSGEPQTSAAPPSAGGPDISVNQGPSAYDIAKVIGLGAAGLGAGRYGASRMGPQPGASVPSPVFAPEVPPAPAPGAPPPTPGAGEPPLVPETAASPMETAMRRATEPFGPPPSYTGDMPPVSTDAIGNYRPGPGTPVENRPLPFNSPQPRVAPTAQQEADMTKLRELNIPKVVGDARRVPRTRMRVP